MTEHDFSGPAEDLLIWLDARIDDPSIPDFVEQAQASFEAQQAEWAKVWESLPENDPYRGPDPYSLRPPYDGIDWAEVHTELENAGMITTVAGSPGVAITDAGRAWVHSRREKVEAELNADAEAKRQKRRQDPDLRALAIRRGILRWLRDESRARENSDVWQILETSHGHYEGEPLTRSDVLWGVRDLARHGLVRQSRSNQDGLRAGITSAGEVCVELYKGDVTTYRDRHPESIHKVTEFTYNGDGGVINVGDNNTTTQIRVEAQDVASFTQKLLQELPGLGLPPEQQEELRGVLERVHQEAADPTEQAGAGPLGYLAHYLADAGKPVLTAVLALIARHYGLPT